MQRFFVARVCAAYFLRAPLRAASWCEKASLAFWGFYALRGPHCSIFGAVLGLRQYYGALLCQAQSYGRPKALFCVCSRRSGLAVCKALASQHKDPSPSAYLQPHRKRSTPGLIPQEPTKPARVVAKLAALVVLASPPPVRAARRCPKVPSARLTLGAIRARRTRRRRNKGLPKAKGCPNPRRRRVKK